MKVAHKVNPNGYQETLPCIEHEDSIAPPPVPVTANRPRETCTLCSNPFPFVCEGCKKTIDEAMAKDQGLSTQRINIGSGEDFCHELQAA